MHSLDQAYVFMRPCTYLLTYLLTYTVGSGRIKPSISAKRLKIELKASIHMPIPISGQ